MSISLIEDHRQQAKLTIKPQSLKAAHYGIFGFDALRAFRGALRLDKSNFKQWLVEGSMTVNTAATTSFLMNGTNWNNSAEAYEASNRSQGASA